MKTKTSTYLLFLTAFHILFNFSVSAQTRKEQKFLTKKDIVGTWQRNDSLLGSGLNQNFQFFDNNTFILNLGNDGDDARSVIKLHGKYRLNKDEIYFTIVSKTIIEGKIEIADPGISLNLFTIEGKTKEVQELHPKELSDPCYITLFSKRHIQINQEFYFKVK
jgi:hypothetical protein